MTKYSANFLAAFPIVFAAEGGLNASDDPNDPGGYTRGGVSLREHPSLTRQTLDDWTVDDFQAFYYSEYWAANGCDMLPWPVCLVVFDGLVNAGHEGIEALQTVLNLKADGIIGLKTRAAVLSQDPVELAARVSVVRDAWYRSQGQFPRYGAGWLKRLFINLYKAGAHGASISPTS